MDNIESFISELSGFLWGWPMLILLLGTHLYLTVRLKFPQRKIFTAVRLSVKKDKGAKGDVSQFGALATSLAATIGTGNIVGVATAIVLGGPGAVLWCWLTGVFGIATKYGEGLLAVKYRVTTEDGRMIGGPMYALERGLNSKLGGILFAFFTSIAAFGIGAAVQSNAIAGITQSTFGVSPVAIGVAVSLVVGAVIIGGVKSIARVCTALVPLMALLYVSGCLVLLCINHEYVLPAIKLICVSAFDPSAVGGGFAGATIMTVMRYGISRGLFSNESGLGSAPIVAAAARTKNPVRQALVSSTGTFWDTVAVCAVTGIVIVSSIIAYPDMDSRDGGALTNEAFSRIPYIGAPILTFGLITFAFSTILGWSYYGEKAMEYLGGRKCILPYRLVFIAVVFGGAVVKLSVVWDLADIFNALMAIPNLLSLLLLSGVIAKETQEYLWENRLDNEVE